MNISQSWLIATDEGGMLDKFIGDAMMCIFGTPVHDDDPDRAVRAAIRMMTDLRYLMTKDLLKGKWPLIMEWELTQILLFQEILVHPREWITQLWVMV